MKTTDLIMAQANLNLSREEPSMPLWNYNSPQRVQPISRPKVPKTMINFHISMLTLLSGARKAIHMSIDPDHSQGATHVGQGPAMIIESSDQVPRATLLKRFPAPRNFGVMPESRIGRGKLWPAPALSNQTHRRFPYWFTQFRATMKCYDVPHLGNL